MKNQYVELIQHMQFNGKKYNPPSIQLGVMINANTLGVGELQINANNIYAASDLILKAGDQVAAMATADGQTYFILCKVARI